MTQIEHPNYYQGEGYDVNNIIEDFELDFWLGNVIKYICRAGDKPEVRYIDDLRKARYYLNFAIEQWEKYHPEEKEQCTH